MAMLDRVTIEAGRLIGETKQQTATMPHDLAKASMAQALAAVTDTSNSYSMNTLADRQELLSQRRRDEALKELEDEDDVLADDASIDQEVMAGAHLDELHAVLDDLSIGKIRLTQEIIDDMVVLMSELRDIMPELPGHLVSEIKEVARPLRQAVADFQNRIEIH